MPVAPVQALISEPNRSVGSEQIPKARDSHIPIGRGSFGQPARIWRDALDGRGDLGLAFGEGESLNSYIVRPVTASKSRACREGYTSGPCRWLFSAARTRQ